MGTNNESGYAQKRDLHIGGTGGSDSEPAGGAGNSGSVAEAFGSAASGVAAAAEMLMESAAGWVTRVKEAALDADDFVRASPWQAIGVVAVLGVAAGYLASRRVVALRS